MSEDRPALWRLEPGEEAPVKLSAGAKRTARAKRMIAEGIHPLTNRALLTDGSTCGGCAHHVARTWTAKTYHKCNLHITGGPATDIRVGWPACTAFVPKETDETP